MRDEQDKHPESLLGGPGEDTKGVERLLAELCELRLLLDSDLTFAAAALDNDAPEMASEILDDEHEALNSLQARILRGLPPVGGTPDVVIPLVRSRRSRLSARAPGLAAAAVAIAVLGATAIPRLHSDQPALAADVAQATDSYDAFSLVAGTHGTDAAQMQAAAAELHESLAPLIAAAGHDEESAQRALALLQAEQFLLMQSQPAGAAAILQQARQLVLKLQAKAPHVVPADAVKAPAEPKPTTAPASKPKATPSPTSSPTPSPTASPSASPTTSPSPSASPSASSSPTANKSSGPESKPTIVPGF